MTIEIIIEPNQNNTIQDFDDIQDEEINFDDNQIQNCVIKLISGFCLSIVLILIMTWMFRFVSGVITYNFPEM